MPPNSTYQEEIFLCSLSMKKKACLMTPQGRQFVLKSAQQIVGFEKDFLITLNGNFCSSCM